MISEKVVKAIDDQINMEYYSAFLYLAMSNEMDAKGFRGYARWLFLQYQEEIEHAEKFIAFVQRRGAEPSLKAIDAPGKVPTAPLGVAEAAFGHEVKVSESIDRIYALATKEEDYATVSFLKWFIDEQVEEESSASDVIWMLEMSAGSKGALFMADRQLGKRKED